MTGDSLDSSRNGEPADEAELLEAPLTQAEADHHILARHVWEWRLALRAAQGEGDGRRVAAAQRGLRIASKVLERFKARTRRR